MDWAAAQPEKSGDVVIGSGAAERKRVDLYDTVVTPPTLLQRSVARGK